jgi:hypothetical protein
MLQPCVPDLFVDFCRFFCCKNVTSSIVDAVSRKKLLEFKCMLGAVYVISQDILKCQRSQRKMDTSLSPNVMVEWLTLLLRIREVPGLNLGPKTGNAV